MCLAARAAEAIDASDTAWAGRSFGAPEFTWGPDRETLRTLEFSGPLYRGKPTNVYALYAAPSFASPARRVPAIVLVHGGAGRAFPEWVKHWVERGYAAIALDVGGKDAPAGFAGPPGFGGYDQISEPLEDQWAFHAVENILRAHSLLRTFPEVDPVHTVIYGVSWGAFLSQVVISLDHRFQAAVAIYGCGFRVEDDELLRRFAGKTTEERTRWTRNWDPASHLARATTPMLFLNGTEDRIFRLQPYHATYRLMPEALRTIKLVVGLRHGQEAATSIPEAERYLDSYCLPRAVPLLRVGAVAQSSLMVRADAHGPARLTGALWWSTEFPGPYHIDDLKTADFGAASRFRAMPAHWDDQGRLTATLTPATQVGFFEVTDEFGARTTSELWFRMEIAK